MRGLRLPGDLPEQRLGRGAVSKAASRGTGRRPFSGLPPSRGLQILSQRITNRNRHVFSSFRT